MGGAGHAHRAFGPMPALCFFRARSRRPFSGPAGRIGPHGGAVGFLGGGFGPCAPGKQRGGGTPLGRRPPLAHGCFAHRKRQPMWLQPKDLSPMDERYIRQHILEGVGEAGQALFLATEVVCEGEGPLLQTAAAYLEAAGFHLAGRTAHRHPGFWPMSWQRAEGGKPLAAAAALRQRGFLGQLPCANPEGFDFWVCMGCLKGKPSFLFARGPNRTFSDGQLEALTQSLLTPAHWVTAAWAALAFEKLALGHLPEAGGGSIGPGGEAELWGLP